MHDGVRFLRDFNAGTGAVDGIITDGFNNDSDMPFEVFDDVLSSDTNLSTFPRRISKDTATNNYGFRLFGFLQNG